MGGEHSLRAGGRGSPCSFFSVSQNFCSSVKYLSRMNTLLSPSVAMALRLRRARGRTHTAAARRLAPPRPAPRRLPLTTILLIPCLFRVKISGASRFEHGSASIYRRPRAAHPVSSRGAYRIQWSAFGRICICLAACGQVRGRS